MVVYRRTAIRYAALSLSLCRLSQTTHRHSGVSARLVIGTQLPLEHCRLRFSKN